MVLLRPNVQISVVYLVVISAYEGHRLPWAVAIAHFEAAQLKLSMDGIAPKHLK